MMLRKVPILLVLLLTILITSCSNVRRDGPPNFYVDERKVPNAVPKVEPLSKSGNMSVYRVFGKRYYTLKTSKNYNEVGIASWYGTKFHARSTSSGEPYNMLAMTAAHKTLPLPTYVKVTNLKNHKQIIVKVNDRGPFENNRLIDLSYVAAKKLGMIGHGTTMVRVTAIDPATWNKPFFPSLKTILTAGRNNKPIYLHAGAFRSKENALQYKKRLAAFVHVPINVYQPRGRSKLFEVQIGPIKNQTIASNISTRLKNLGINVNRIYGA